jgi:hypothetical protein
LVVVVVPLLVDVELVEEVVVEELVVLIGDDVVVVTVGVAVVVEVIVAVGERRLVTVSHRPVMGSMIVHDGDREIWARETSLPLGRRNRVSTSPRLAATESCAIARLKRRALTCRHTPWELDRVRAR